MFIEQVLSSYDRYSYYVAINVKSEQDGRYIIENDDFFYFYQQTEGLDKQEYAQKVKGKFQNNEIFDLRNIDLSKWNFIRVKEIPTISESAKKGREKFIETYFEGRVLKDGITDNERAAIVDQLFKWQIPANIDDETGYLVIPKR